MPTVNLYTERGPHVAGGLRMIFGSYSGPNPYVAGGDPLAPGDIGLGDIEDITFDPTPTQMLLYNHATGKVAWYVTATGAEAAGNLAAVTVRFRAVGK